MRWWDLPDHLHYCLIAGAGEAMIERTHLTAVETVGLRIAGSDRIALLDFELDMDDFAGCHWIAPAHERE